MTDVLSQSPADALRSRLDDPKVASALNVMLDNADTLALGLVALDGLLRRSETILGNVEGSISDVKALGQSVSFLAGPTRRMAEDAPQIADAAEALLESGMLSREVVALLGTFAGALVQGVEAAQLKGTTINGVVPLVKLLKDPEVGRGLGIAVEIARALGRAV